MVSCSQCGTQNRDGSKFCNGCGARLKPASDGVCPACGYVNPAEAHFCSSCGARLVPAAPPPPDKPAAPLIKGLSLPTKLPASPAAPPPPAPAALPAPPAPAAPTAPPAPAPSESPMPDWMASLREAAVRSDTEPSPLVDKVASPQVEEGTGAGEEDSTEGIPDWLTQPLGPAPEPEKEPAPSTPDWLADTIAKAVEPEPPEAEPPDPTWVKRIREEASAEPSAPAVEQPDVPTWVKRIREEASAEPSTPAVEPEVPSWVQKLQAEEQAYVPPVQKSEEPSWLDQLRALTPAQETEPAAEETIAPSPFEPVQEERAPEPAAWWSNQAAEETLKEPPAEEPSAGLPAAPAEEPAPAETTDAALIAPGMAQDQIPEWLKGWHIVPPEQEEAAETSAAEAEEPETSVQSFASLKQALLASKAAAPVPAAERAEEAAPGQEEGIPDWLRVAAPVDQQAGPKPAVEQPTPVKEPPAEPAQEPVAIEPARPDEVPAWIAALKPAETAPPTSAAVEEPFEAAGPLAGLRGVLPLAIAITEPHTPQPGAPESGKGDARFFDTVLAEPVVEAEGRPAPTTRRARTVRSVIYALLALAVVLPFLIPSDLTGSFLPISNTSAAEFYDVVQRLRPDSTVVVVFDYDPSVAGEMDLQANALVRDLVQRGIKIVALSTLETGPQLAKRVLDSAVAGRTNYQYGTSYLNVGYVPGHEVGLAQLAASGLSGNVTDYERKRAIQQYPVTSNWNWQNVALVIELAGSDENLQTWMEQFQPRVKVPIAAGVSAAVEPRARVYFDANQLTATMSGLVGAAEYEILSNRSGQAVGSAGALGAALLVLMAGVIVGNAVFWISRMLGKTA